VTESRKHIPFPVLPGMLWILLVSILTAGLHAVMWDGELPHDFSPGSAVRAQAEAEGVPVVLLADMQAMMTQGTHLALDARPLEQYSGAHIPTALSLPVHDFEMGMAELAGFLEPSMPLVTYCTGPDCDDALRLALRLREAGFADVSIFVGGMEEWEAQE